MKSTIWLAAAGALAALLMATGAAAGEGKTAYAPMKPFEPYAGKVWRGEGKDPAGKPVIDIAEWEFIIGGRALQVTHSIGEGAYGGRTIYFFDESAKKYLFHYFTTDGFHTTGDITLNDEGFEAVEYIKGHPTITEARGAVKPTAEGFAVDSKYLSEGKWVEGHGFNYKAYTEGKPSFEKTSTAYKPN